MNESPDFGLFEEEEIPMYTGDPQDPNTPQVERTLSSDKIKQEMGEKTPTAKPKAEEKPQVEQKENSFVNDLKNKAFDFATDQFLPLKSAKEAANVVGIMAQNEAGVEKKDRPKQEAEAAMTLGAIDFATDVVGNVPGLGGIDDAWDEKTKFTNPLAREVRSISSVVIPSMVAGGPVAGAMSKLGGGNALARGVMGITGRAGVDVAVAGLSDYSERDEGVMNALDGLLDKMGNPYGFNIPEAAKVQDSDSMETRHFKLMMEAAGFSVVGDMMGYLFKKTTELPWFKAKNQDAKDFLDYLKTENPDLESVELISQYRQMADEATDSKVAKKYNDFADDIEKMMKETGISTATTDPAESYVRKQQTTRDLQNDDIASAHIQSSAAQGIAPDQAAFKPEVHANMVDEADKFKQAVPKGNVARNAADIAAMAKEGDRSTYIPAPVVTDAMKQKGLMLDQTSREILEPVVAEVKAAGNFDAVINDIRYSQKEMDDAAFELAAEIVEAPDGETIRKLLAPKRDIKNFRDKALSYLNAEQTAAVGFALKKTIDNFLDPDTVLTSARTMKTIARETSAVAEASDKLKGAVSPIKSMEVQFDNMAYLLEEQGISKYVAGWSLQNQAWWKRIGKTDDDMLQNMFEGFNEFAQKNKERARTVAAEYKRLILEDPEKAELLSAAINASDGELDSLLKINEWVATQVNPGGLLFDSTGRGGNLFAKSLKSIWYNNVLSGGSAMKAAIGNASQQLLQPLEYMVGAGLQDIMTGGKYNQVKAGFHAYSSILSTNGLALKNAWTKFMKASKDPDSVNALVRQDYKFGNEEMFDLLEASIPELEKTGKKGQKILAQWTLFNRDMAKNPVLRWGTNAMIGVDQYSATLNATASSRFRSYWETMGSDTATRATLETAEKKHYAKVFDKNGVIKDNWVKETTSSIALNQDNAVGDVISGVTNTFPVLTPFMSFPTTGSNWIRRSFEYGPVSRLVDPKIKSALLAESPEDVAKALTLHGIDPKDLAGENIIRNLKALYTGRIVLGTGITMGLMNYAMSGNIRGNWPMSSADKRAWQEAGIKPKTINIAGKQVSYDGVLPFDPLLTIIGDMATYSRDISEPVMTNFRDKVAWTLASSYVNNTPLGGLEPLVALAGGDDSAIARVLANQARSFIPMSGAFGVVANATNSTQKDIYNDFQAYIFNKIPVVNQTLVESIDPYTGKKFNDITNPWLRLINSVSNVKFYDGPEEWRQKLVDIGMPGTGILRKDSSGTVEYDAETRQIINKLVGAQEPWREIEKMLNDPAYMDSVNELREYRKSGKDDPDKVRLDEQQLPIIRDIKKLMRKAQVRAEAQLIADPKYSHIIETRIGQQIVKNLMSQGKVPEAIDIAQKTAAELDELQRLGVGN